MRVLSNFFLILLAITSVFSISRVSNAEIMDEPSRLMDFADGLFSRQVYDLAAMEYSRLIDKYPNFRNVNLARFRRGECDFLRNKYADAIPFFAEVVKIDSELELTRAALFRLGSCHYFTNGFDNAIEVLKKLQDEENGEYYIAASSYFIAKSLIALSKVEEAKEYLEKASSGKQYGHLAAYTRAKIAFEEKDYEKAATFYQKTIDLTGLKGLGLYAALSMAEAYRKIGKTEKACDVFRQIVAVKVEEVSFPAGIKYAIMQLENDQPKAAITMLQELLLQYPSSKNCGEANLLQGRAYSTQKDWENARKSFQAALSGKLEQGREAEAEEGYLRSLLELEEYSTIISYATTITVNPPEKFNSWLLVAQAYEKQKEFDKALGIYKHLQESGHEPYQRFSRLRYALLLCRIGKDEKALEVCLKFAELYPKDNQTAVLLCKAGDCAVSLSKFEQAETIFGNVISGSSEKKELVYSYYRRAVARYFLKQTDNMACDLKEIVDMPEAKEYLDSILLMLGDYEQEREDLPMAIVYFKRLVRECPNSSKFLKARFRLAACYYQRELYDKSATEYDSIIRDGNIREVPQDALLWVVQYLAAHDRAQDAINICSTALETIEGKPEYLSEVLFLLSETLEKSGNAKSAEKYYRQLLDSYPKSPRKYSARLGIARCLRKKGDISRAEQELKSLINETTNRMKSMVTLELADLEYSQKRYEEALRDYSFVAILEDDEELAAPALLGAAKSSHALKRYVDATRFASELVEKFPNSKLKEQAQKLITVKKP